MTLNGAIMQLVELHENSMMPEIFKPAIQKVIEAVSECEERKAGKWIPKDDARYYCSSCDGIAPKGCKWNYCPNCGAEMRGEQE